MSAGCDGVLDGLGDTVYLEDTQGPTLFVAGRQMREMCERERETPEYRGRSLGRGIALVN